MDGTAFVEIFPHSRVFDNLNDLELVRLLGILNRVRDFEIESATWHCVLQMREEFSLQNTIE